MVAVLWSRGLQLPGCRLVPVHGLLRTEPPSRRCVAGMTAKPQVSAAAPQRQSQHLGSISAPQALGAPVPGANKFGDRRPGGHPRFRLVGMPGVSLSRSSQATRRRTHLLLPRQVITASLLSSVPSSLYPQRPPSLRLCHLSRGIWLSSCFLRITTVS